MKANLPLTLTRITGPTDATLTKVFTLDASGHIRKQSQPRFSEGQAETITIDQLSALEPLLTDLAPNQCITTGVFDQPTCTIVPKARLTPQLVATGHRARTLEYVHQPDPGLLLFDYDPSPFSPPRLQCASATDVIALLEQAVPEFGSIGFSGVGSSSCGVYDRATGARHTGSGIHLYVATSAIDPDAFKRWLEVQLWNADLGFIALARNGAMLPRTLLDMSVLSPERLIFAASPVLGEGVERDVPHWLHRPGELLTGAFVLTDEAIAEYEQRVSAAKSSPDIIAASRDLCEAHYATRVKSVAEARSISVEEAAMLVPRQPLPESGRQESTLYLADVVEILDERITIAELLARGTELDATSMPDPIEGAEYGASTAMFYYNAGNNPCIHSFAHGVRTVYTICEFEPCETVVVEAAKKPVPGVESARNSIDRAAALPATAFPQQRTLSNGGISIPTTIPNVAHLLEAYGVEVRYDVFKKSIQVHIPGLEAAPENYLNTALNQILSLATLNGLSTAQLPAFIETIADRHQVNPVADWILSIPWDGVDRLPAVYATLHERDDYSRELKEILVYRWLMSCVAVALLPSGFHSRGVLTLQGSQSIGKTQWVRALISNTLIREKYVKIDHHLDVTSKDSVVTAITHFIVELGELDSSLRKDVARLKGFVTSDSDKLRRPYARGNAEYQRRTVFCATVNDLNFLVDPSGNTRWWTIPVVKIDYAHGIDMQQAFAQLAHAFNSGDRRWWLTKDEEAQLETHNRKHLSISAVHDLLQSGMHWELPEDQWAFLAPIEVLRHLGMKNPGNRQCKECADFLRAHFGQERKRKGKVGWLVALPSNITSIDDRPQR